VQRRQADRRLLVGSRFRPGAAATVKGPEELKNLNDKLRVKIMHRCGHIQESQSNLS